MDGFDGRDILDKWTVASGTPSVTNNPTPLHGFYANLGNSGIRYSIPAADQDDLITVGFHIFPLNTGIGGFAQPCAFYGDNGTVLHTVLTWDAAGIIYIRRAGVTGTIIGQSDPGIFIVNSWYHIGIKVLLHDSAGTVDVWLDGVNVISETGVDTKNGGSGAVFDAVQFNAASGVTLRIDDFYCLNSVDSGIAGAPNNDFLGVCQVESILPTSDETYTDFTPSAGADHFAMVDEVPPDDDTTYVEADVEGEKDSYGFADLPAGSWTVHGVQSNSNVRRSASGMKFARGFVRVGGTDYPGDSSLLSETYHVLPTMFEANPDTAAQWLASEVDAIEAGIEVRDS